MKIEWQESDIRGGRIVAKPGRTERWMIGYFADPGVGRSAGYAMVSMSDGMITNIVTASELCALLNSSGDYPAEFVDASKQKAA